MLTRKAERLLRCASVIFYDALVGREIVAMAAPGTRLVYVGKRSGRHSQGQPAIDRLIVDAALTGAECRLRMYGTSLTAGRTVEVEV